MSNDKATGITQFVSEDLIEIEIKSEYLEDSSNAESPKPQKRKNSSAPAIQEEQMVKLMGVNYKKRKISDSQSVDTPQRVRETFMKQIETRKQCTDLMLNNLSNILTELDDDYATMKGNQAKCEQATRALLKCIKQSNAAQKQELKSLREIHDIFRKGVEGLITRGAMKPDDRPLWFDIYKKFPPVTEPKFAKPLPEIKPVRPILYQEDIIRAKFHSSGHGYGAVNMLSPTGDTHIKKLVKQYEKLKSEGVPESELVEKASAAFETQRQPDFSAPKTANNPDSVTAQVLAEADLKNIFNDK